MPQHKQTIIKVSDNWYSCSQ